MNDLKTSVAKTVSSKNRARRGGSLAALGAAAALVATLGLAGDADGRSPSQPTTVLERAASQQVIVPADHRPPAADRQIRGGEASYYHDSLAGNPTASGKPYRPTALTAAHQTLPLGSKVRVTSEETGRSVVVEVNDRGPFAKDRVIDLSRAAAKQLGMIHRGHAEVRLELVG
ncbi:MAG TPA: septal ring lytic transglycosylase RlpA family protein [Thermoanaerobaculia bacterium]